MSVHTITPAAPVMARPVVVVSGHTGPSGGPTGPTGELGPTGAPGPASVIGPTGPFGTGPTGQLGPTGTDGPRGLTGPPGAVGSPGPIGPTGVIGPTGTALQGVFSTQAFGPIGPYGTSLTAIGIGISYAIKTTGFVCVTISGMVRNSTGSGGGETYLNGIYGQGTPPVAGQTTALGAEMSCPIHFKTIDPDGYYGFTIQFISTFPGLSLWWFDLAFASIVGSVSYVRDVQYTVIEY